MRGCSQFDVDLHEGWRRRAFALQRGKVPCGRASASLLRLLTHVNCVHVVRPTREHMLRMHASSYRMHASSCCVHVSSCRMHVSSCCMHVSRQVRGLVQCMPELPLLHQSVAALAHPRSSYPQLVSEGHWLPIALYGPPMPPVPAEPLADTSGFKNGKQWDFNHRSHGIDLFSSSLSSFLKPHICMLWPSVHHLGHTRCSCQSPVLTTHGRPSTVLVIHGA